MSAPCLCPNGALAISPGLRGTSYPGFAMIDFSQPQRSCGDLSVHPGHNPVGVVRDSQPNAQGSRCAATLGWRPQSRWDCSNSARECLVERSPSPRPSPPGRGSRKPRPLVIRQLMSQSPHFGVLPVGNSDKQPRSNASETASISPSLGGEGRGEGGRHTIWLLEKIRIAT
jgi:hypothetical protein